LIQETSLEAFESIQMELGERQRQFYNLIKLYPGVSNHDLSRIAQLPINSVTPRVNELRRKGLVVFSHYKQDRVTNRRVMTWVVTC